MRPVTYSITGVGTSSVCPTDHYVSPFNVALNVVVSGTITYTVMGNANGPAIYTTPAAQLTADEDLGNVTITQGTTTILNNTSGINSLVGTIGTATGTASLRSDYSAFGPYTLNASGVYSLSVGVITTAPTNWFNAVGVYIDLNRNGSFADLGEKVYASTTTTSGAHTETARTTNHPLRPETRVHRAAATG